ncbi:potassium transporter [Ligilactobacillus pabuli]|uniref:Potassium transporter n=1 Tax=Ligilactobacillus pabuli TaxID=2886039 RepID=A0ABQ5JGP8_9LACO|nr:cation:proton antiporter family protein [Ligilactobacillus pabuli]GKS81246.1 potassium transporter [Ligilactobacillus pabuli]
MNFSLVVVALAAYVTPMLLARFKVSFLPSSIAEILVGIILGKSFLNVIHTTDVLTTMSTLGVVLLLFLSGMEIDFTLFKKTDTSTALAAKKATKQQEQSSPVSAASLAYGLTVICAVVLALLLRVTGLFADFYLAAILLGTVALGIVIGILKENDLLGKKYGQTILLFAVLGEVIPLLALTIYSSLKSGNGGALWLISLVFLAALWLLYHFRNFFANFQEYTKSTTQLDMRLAFLVIIVLVVLAETVGAENILGAFLAGIVIKLLEPAESTQQKLDALGYGFLIPFYFILTGANLDLPALLSSKTTLLLIPLLLVAFLLAKLPAYFGFRKLFGKSNAWAATMLSETTITLILAATTVAQNIGAMTASQSGAFIIAGILTCLLNPILFKHWYHPEYEPTAKTDVHVIGASLVAVNALKGLPQDWYDIKIYTDNIGRYHAYKGVTDISLLTTMDADKLIADGVFDTNILVLAHRLASDNYELALAAKEYGVPRVVLRLDEADPDQAAAMKAELDQKQIESFSTFTTGVGVLRAAIQSPEVLRLLTSTDAEIFELQLTNARFDGIDLADLPEIQNVVISRIVRHGKFLPPHGHTSLQLGDHLLLSGNREVVAKLREILNNRNQIE